MIKKYAFICITFLVLLGCSSVVYHSELILKKDAAFPRWLSAGNFNADQTSGITFLKENRDGSKNFLLADDTGSILRFIISKDTIFTIKPLHFSKNFQTYIDTFPKADFEEIVYDNKDNEVYISIEGNGPHPEIFAGIYKLEFKNKDVFSDTLEGIKKINFTPEEEFKKYLANNIGYEGLTVDEHYFYLGLEGFTNGKIFSDSTILFIADKSTHKIIKQISTKPLGIHTICGLYSDKNYSVYGIDRNNKTFFHLSFDRDLNIIDSALIKIKTNIPNYTAFDYVASIESVTMDPEKNIYMVDDPWKTFFIPSDEILNQLDSLTVNRFRNFVPVIFKYSLSK